MGRKPQGKEKSAMKCHVCGASLSRLTTDLPFKLREGSIVIIRRLPILQCRKCPEYLLEDQVMTHVEELLKSVREGTELEIVQYAA
jgi:YgiT-type zinc finger domain-containing protein